MRFLYWNGRVCSCSIFYSIQHPNIIQLYEVFQDDINVYLVMEYVEGESLLSFMKKRQSRRCSIDQAREIFRQVLAGVTYCHQNQIAHRDIKLENVLISKSVSNDAEQRDTVIPTVKIIDFGFALRYEIGEKGDTFCGTPSYMAPELIKKQEFDYELVDVWALGVLFYAILTGLFPFKGASNRDMYCKIIKGSYVVPERIPIQAKRLIIKMLQVDPEHRRRLRTLNGKLQYLFSINSITHRQMVDQGKYWR